MDKEEYKWLRELQKQKDRSEIANQLVRTGILINGGGAIALLGFMQATVGQPDVFKSLVFYAVIATALFVAGLIAAVYANKQRIEVSHHDNDPVSVEKKKRRDASIFLQHAPASALGLGCGFFALGLWIHF